MAPTRYRYLFLAIVLAAFYQFTEGMQTPCAQKEEVYKDLVCERATFNLKCPVGKTISVISALYGRQTSSVCTRGTIRNTNCGNETRSLLLVQEQCDGRRTCDIQANNRLFGDPCRGTFKYLEIVYKCEAPVMSALVCERDTIQIECPTGQTISVKSALYGRQSSSDCPNGSVGNTNCNATTSFSVVQQQCDGRQTCIVQALNNVFGDPCRGTFKYLEVEYMCEVPVMSGYVCERDNFHLECPVGRVISVTSALYGRQTSLVCARGSVRNTNCGDETRSLAVVQQQCDGRQTCDIQATNRVFGGNPCRGTFKYLEIDYSCEDAVMTNLVCERDTSKIECPPGLVISVQSALYGRQSSLDCPNGAVGNTNCNATTSFSLVQQECDGLGTCDIRAINDVFGDPCRGTFKYLEIQYTCEAPPPPAPIGLINDLVCERDTFRLECPAGQTITTISALYGRQTSTVCTGSGRPIRTTNCGDGASSLAVVQQRCDGRRTCNLQATNGVFDDPCVGTYKYLEIQYKCEAAPPAPIGLVNDLVCERDTFRLECPAGQTITTISALYGRQTSTICTGTGRPIRTTNCGDGASSLAVVQQRCDGRRTCDLQATNGVFDDPCVGTYKYLEIQYKCEEPLPRYYACEGNRLRMICRPGYTIHVESALYGRQISTICTGGNRPINTLDCSASNSYDIVAQQCEGRRFCSVAANNGVFDDPCRGTYKYLQVGYTCQRPQQLTTTKPPQNIVTTKPPQNIVTSKPGSAEQPGSGENSKEAFSTQKNSTATR